MDPKKVEQYTDDLMQAINSTVDLLQRAEEFDKHYGLGKYKHQARKMTKADYIELQQGTVVDHDN